MGGGKVAWVHVFLLCFVMTFEMRNAAASTGPSPQARRPATPPISASGGICKSMVERYSYVCQEHTVTTKDGYILGIQRIPQGLTNNTSGSRTPILLQHGVLVDGNSWLMNSPHESIAFILADSGFDVWIANSRGTQWSRRHTSLNPNNPAQFLEYWDWTWDELAAYDLPAFVQYVYDQTNQKMHYVGHSQGTLIALASFSQRKLLDKLKSAALLSPIAHMGQMSSPLLQAISRELIQEPIYWLGLGEFNLRGEEVNKLLEGICKNPGTNCADMMTAFTGKNCCVNSSAVVTFLEHEPQASSTKNLIHFAQMIRDSTIAMYDYGEVYDNMKHYWRLKPTVYDMSNIPNDFPLFLSYGGKDALSDVNDVKLLLKDLNSHEGDKLTVQYIDNYAHMDFILASNAKQVVYDPMIAFFKLHGDSSSSSVFGGSFLNGKNFVVHTGL